MPIFLRQSTASQEIGLGYFVDSIDGNTEETGLTINNTDIKLHKTGATTLANKNSGGGTHISNGVYYAVLDATDTDTIGPMVVFVHVSGALAVRVQCCVLDEAVYDSLFGTAALITSGTGTSQLSVASGQVLVQSGTGTGQLSVTSGVVAADAVAVSGDTTAADALEFQFDGTGLTGSTYPSRQDQLTSLTIGSAALNTSAASFTATTVTVASGTYASTAARDATYHQLQDVAGTLDCYYEFDVGADGIPALCTIYGHVNSGNDTTLVSAYNWGGSAWQQVGSIIGVGGSTDSQSQFSLYTSHVGTGANIGKVRIRLHATGATSSNTYVDQIYVGYAIVNRSVGYALGSVWLDTVNGTSGTTVFTNGTADHPVSTLADARTLCTAIGIKSIRVVNGSSVTLASATQNFTFAGENWTLALGGQDIAGSSFRGAHVTGTSSGASHTHFDECSIGTATIPPLLARNCYVEGTITMASAGEYFFLHCGDGVSGAASAELTFAANCNLHCQNWSGGITLNSMASTDTFEMGGRGHLTIAASCSNASVVVRGCFSLTNSGTGMTITDDARWNEDQNVTNVTGSVAALGDARIANLDAAVSSRAATGAQMALIDDAITLAKVDTGVTVGATAQGGSRELTIHIQDGATNPLPDVSVSLFDSTDSTGLDRRVTGGNGDAGPFSVDDGDYNVRLQHAGYTFTVPEALTVGGDETHTFTGVAVVVADDVDVAAYEKRPLRRQKVRYQSTNADAPLKFGLVIGGQKAAITSATITIYAPGQTTALVTAAAMTCSGSLATYSVDTSTIASWPVATGYLAHIAAVSGSTTYQDDIIFDVAKFLLVLDISRDQLMALDDRLRAMDWAGDEDLSEVIDAVRDELQMLIETRMVNGRPLTESMALDKSRVSIPARYRVLAQIFEAKQNTDAADRYNKRFDELWRAMLGGAKFDLNEDKAEDSKQSGVPGIRLRY